MIDPATSQQGDRQPGPRDPAGVPSARAAIPRGERARERVLRAALAVLADRGMSGFSIEAVAQRAGASKATVYRRWPSQGALLVDALELVSQPLPLPATGRLRTDLIELVSGLQAVLSEESSPRLMAAFIDAAERDPTLKALHAELTERRRAPVRHVLTQARQRGDIPSTVDIELAIDLLGAPAFYRRFIAHRGFPRRYAAAVVDRVLAAVGYAPARCRRGGTPAGPEPATSHRS